MSLKEVVSYFSKYIITPNFNCNFISVSELSFQEGSVYNSDLETANYDQESETQEIDVKEHLRIMEHKPTVDQSKFHQHQNSQQKLTSPSTLPTTNYPAQIQGLQEEILHLRSTVALLQSELACREQEVEEYERDEVCLIKLFSNYC